MTSLVPAVAMQGSVESVSAIPSARSLNELANTREATSLLLPVDLGDIGLFSWACQIGDANPQDPAHLVIAEKIDDVTRISSRLHDFCLAEHSKLLRDGILLEIEEFSEFPNRILPCHQQPANLEPHRMRQRLKHLQHTVGCFGRPGIPGLEFPTH